MHKKLKKSNNPQTDKSKQVSKSLHNPEDRDICESIPSAVIPGNLNKNLLGVLIFAVVIIVLIVHWPGIYTKANGFDDYQYFMENNLVKNPSWASASKFLTEVLAPSTVLGYYQPLSMISLMLDYKICGSTNNIMPVHITSLVLHLLNTSLIILLLYLIFRNPWVSAVSGLIFGIHPMTVEVIVWTGERKTTLATFFALLMLISYVLYTKKSDKDPRYKNCYFISIFLFILSLMSKPTSTMLPVALLLMDYWPLGRFESKETPRKILNLFLEKVPFFITCIISAIVTYLSQKNTAGVTLPEKFSLTDIPLTLCHNIVFYLEKIILPFDLTPHYPMPDPLSFSNPTIILGVFGTFTLLSILLISLVKTKAPLIGWLIFFIIILPTMQIVGFSDVLTSDKYAYLPSIGILMILASALCKSYKKIINRKKRSLSQLFTLAFIIFFIIFESITTRSYFPAWKDTVTLYNYMINLAPNSYVLYYNLGVEYRRNKNNETALYNYRQSIRLNPQYVPAYLNLGNILRESGQLDNALKIYETGGNILLGYFPKEVSKIHYYRGEIFFQKGDLAEAIASYRQALQTNPNLIDASNKLIQLTGMDPRLSNLNNPKTASDYINLGDTLVRQGKYEEAETMLKQALSSNPTDTDLYEKLANALVVQKKFDECAYCYQKILELKPNSAKALCNLGAIFYYQGKYEDAMTYYKKAIVADPSFENAHVSLASTLYALGEVEAAIAQYKDYLKINPSSEKGHRNLGKIYEEQGALEEAIKEYTQVLKINPFAEDIRGAIMKIK